MKILLIDNGSSYLGSLENLLSNYSVKVISYQSHGRDYRNYDAIILSGGHSASIVGHPEIYQKEIELVRSWKKPLLGICLGFEIIAYVFDALLGELEGKREGVVTIEVTYKDSIFGGLEKFDVYESHRWVVRNSGKNLLELARLEDGIEVVKHKDRPIYGFQFHPEVLMDKSDIGIFKNFLELAKKFQGKKV